MEVVDGVKLARAGSCLGYERCLFWLVLYKIVSPVGDLTTNLPNTKTLIGRTSRLLRELANHGIVGVLLNIIRYLGYATTTRTGRRNRREEMA